MTSAEITTARCATCRSWLPVEHFGVDASQPSGLCKSCRGCRAEAHRRHRQVSTLRCSRDHARRKATHWRQRHEALLAALAAAPPELLAALPDDVRPKPMAIRRARAETRKRTQR